MLLPIPAPYDFELSTTRFRNFGSDGATVWHEGGLHRVVAGREVRITPAEGGVAIEPWSEEAAAEVASLLGLAFDLDSFYEWAAGDATLELVIGSVPGFRPTMNPQPFEALVVAITTQQISLHAAASIRGNLVRRYGVRHDVAWEFPTREQITQLRPRHFTPLGFSRAKAEYVLELAHSDLDLDGLAALDDDAVIAALTLGAGTRALDGGLVPRTSPRAAARVACRRPRCAQGGLDLLRCRPRTVHRGGPSHERAIRAVRESVRPVPARRRPDGGLTTP